MQNYTITLTEDELKLMRGLIDEGIKAVGAQAAALPSLTPMVNKVWTVKPDEEKVAE